MASGVQNKPTGPMVQVTPAELIHGQRELGQALNSTTSFEETLSVCLEHAVSLSGLDAGGIYLVDEASGNIDLMVHQGLSPAFVASSSHYDADAPNARMVLAGKPIYANHQEMDDLVDETRSAERLRALAVIPVVNQGQVIACLNVASHQQDEVPEFAHLVLETLGTQMAGAIMRAVVSRSLEASEQKYRAIYENSLNGIALHQIILDDAGQPVDYIFLDVNPAFTELTGLSAELVLGKRVTEVLPGIEKDPFIEIYGRTAETGKPVRFQQYTSALDKHYSIQTYSPRRGQFVTVFSDVTKRIKGEEELKAHREHLEELVTERTAELERANVDLEREVSVRRRMEQALRDANTELERSNQDLEQFAYAASHDLQEPLRMISSYLQLLERRYGGELDEAADEFIGYAVDGAKRMRGLIDSLLVYSRVGRSDDPVEKVDCERVLGRALANLRRTIEERGAQITHDPLPEVTALEGQLVQLLQNLISNGIKFCETDPPEVHVSAQREDDHWVFAVRDNGLGIDPEFAERIFGVFQRLHKRDVYPGTGIGLAICKRIVKRHNGRIWVESRPGEGATFSFTIPDPKRGVPDGFAGRGGAAGCA